MTLQGVARLKVQELSPDPLPLDAFADALSEAYVVIDEWREQVAKGRVISKFGEKSQKLIDRTARSVGVVAADFARALDGALSSLYFQQLAIVQQNVFERFRRPRARGHLSALAIADRVFVEQAGALALPGSEWGFDQERAELTKALKAEHSHGGELSAERARSAQIQRVIADVIGRTQKEMEQLGEIMYGASAGNPWALWTTFRLPRTPLQVSGRYRAGRTNFELSLAPDKDPVNAEAGFVDVLTPKNVGVSLNVGV